MGCGCVGVPPSDGGDGGRRPAGGGDLRHPPPEHSPTVNFDQAHYGTVSIGGAAPEDKVVEAVGGNECLDLKGMQTAAWVTEMEEIEGEEDGEDTKKKY